MKPRLIVAVLVLALLGVGGWLIDRSRAQNESRLSGFFESEPAVTASRIGGRITQILVKEGDTVKAGQPLVRLEAKSYEASVAAQQAGAEQAQQEYLETLRGPRKEDIQKQMALLSEAQSNYLKFLHGPRPQEIQAAQDKLRQAKAQYDKLRAGSRPEEIAAAKAAARVALQKLKASERGLTSEERAQLKARLGGATAAELLARQDLERTRILFTQGALARAQYDAAISTDQQAQAKVQDAAEAYKRAAEGTPPEERAEAREAYRQAQAQLDLVLHGSRREDIESARQEFLGADANLRLLLAGSRSEDVRAARAQVQQAQAALSELERGSRIEDVAKAAAAHKQAVATAESGLRNLDEATVFAPTGGLVDRVLIAQGDLVAPGSPIVQLSDPTNIWLRVYLPEAELHKVKVNDHVDLVFDGIPNPVEGRVESIDAKGQFTPANLQSPEERGKQVFGIRIVLTKSDSRIRAGMYATVARVGQWP